MLPGDILVLSAEGFYDDKRFGLSELKVTADNDWCDKAISEISMPDNELIVMIKRNGGTVIPNGKVIIENNDVLVITSNA